MGEGQPKGKIEIERMAAPMCAPVELATDPAGTTIHPCLMTGVLAVMVTVTSHFIPVKR